MASDQDTIDRLTADNEAKDPIDMLRYGFDRLIFRRRGGVERREVR